MNFKTLHILFFTIVAIMIFSVGSKISKVASGFMEGFKVASENIGEYDSQFDRHEENTLPLMWSGANILVKPDGKKLSVLLENEEKTSSVEVRPMSCLVVAKGNVGNSFELLFLNILQTILAFTVLGIGIAVLFFIFRLFVVISRALNRKVVFDLKVIRSMRVLGILLLAQAVVHTAFMYLQGTIGNMVFECYNIEVLRLDYIEYGQLILALATIMVSEIFRIGHQIQEEQSLTV